MLLNRPGPQLRGNADEKPRKQTNQVFWWICDPARSSLGAIRLNEPGSVSDRAGASEGGAGCDPQLEHAHDRSSAQATRPVHILRIRQHLVLVMKYILVEICNN